MTTMEFKFVAAQGVVLAREAFRSYLGKRVPVVWLGNELPPARLVAARVALDGLSATLTLDLAEVPDHD